MCVREGESRDPAGIVIACPREISNIRARVEEE